MTEYISPPVQSMKLIRYIGDAVSRTGHPIHDLPDMSAEIGAQSAELAGGLLEELQESGLVKMEVPVKMLSGTLYQDVDLSLDGWKQYYAEKPGEHSGVYGFLARKFDEPELDNFVHDVLKPTVEESVGYKLHDMNDVSRAGVIDNIIRSEIEVLTGGIATHSPADTTTKLRIYSGLHGFTFLVQCHP